MLLKKHFIDFIKRIETSWKSFSNLLWEDCQKYKKNIPPLEVKEIQKIFDYIVDIAIPADYSEFDKTLEEFFESIKKFINENNKKFENFKTLEISLKDLKKDFNKKIKDFESMLESSKLEVEQSKENMNKFNLKVQEMKKELTWRQDIMKK